jgi:hypothetical protein
MLSATPRLPDDDSTSTGFGVRTPSRSAASTISVAAFSLIEPAKLKPSHFQEGRVLEDRPEVCGADMIGTSAPPHEISRPAP